MEVFHTTVYWVSIAYFWFVLVGAVLGAIPASLGTISRRVNAIGWVSQVIMPAMARAFQTCFGALWRILATAVSTAAIAWAMLAYHGSNYAIAYLVLELYYYIVCCVVVRYYMLNKSE
jgi:hypothetical protein